MLVDWHSLGEVVYRKWQVYDMGWGDKFDIDDYVICGAPYGGPLALIKAEDRLSRSIVVTNAEREQSKASLSTESGECFNQLWIFSSAGKLISEVEFDVGNKRNVVMAMGWTDEEQLVIVLIDG